jgi:septation ring formation regulator EzrA
MDYDRSVIGMVDRIEFIYEDLRRIYSLISTEINIKLDVNNLLSLTNKLTKSKTQISLEVCNSLCIEIDKITIRYITSELPPMPQWDFS